MASLQSTSYAGYAGLEASAKTPAQFSSTYPLGSVSIQGIELKCCFSPVHLSLHLPSDPSSVNLSHALKETVQVLPHAVV